MLITVILIGFTWELPQSILALICILVLRAKLLDSEDRFRFVFKSESLSSFSLGEFIFFNEIHTRSINRDTVQKHEYGHSRQSC